MVVFLWEVVLLCKALQSSGICDHFFSRDFPDVLASKGRYNRGHEPQSDGGMVEPGVHGNGASSGSSSCMHFGSLNKALTCRANLSMSSSRRVDSSAHQSGTSHLSAFHCTHLVGWDMGGSSDISSFSSSVISRQSLQEGSYFSLELWWFPQV